ncbi:hypothetical protein TVAG_306640 [Trichomonas vaginalis G3]|uniref:receptor protein-tyrosine kinase n=1 Tax=Trichomonas vaginalis (strain ATCC PRA-98 / G3) TaxID=412133 RepID=A2DNF4_TRIV3|nr:glycine-rich protein family [Trichomonas vaginalis G3]EAY18142.1 hypothetical protein TVAG_306640 [Trichomonas vaginalis G3]KAI5492419.1 glycine-rich protein family [Trichomonas vaginalis G3]|eukprot:XP_001579128.1 hypothetical protein [Trichomonas vaginalis G3]
MVAGTGGGCCKHYSSITGNGGGIKGEDGVLTINPGCLNERCNDKIEGTCLNTILTGGNQTSGGIDANSTQISAKFGIGGYLGFGKSRPSGGSGYYGGGYGIDSNCIISCGAGGSSFVSGLIECDAINESSSGFDNILHTHQPVHYSGYKFTDAIMLDGGNSEIPQPESTIFYDGACQITILSDFISFFITCQVSFISSQTFFLSFVIFIQS